MKKLIIVCLAVVMAVAFGYGSAFAASAKATAQLGNLAVIKLSSPEIYDPSGSQTWTPVFSQKIKTAQDKDLFIDVSMECGLTTNTKVMSKLLARSVADAEAVVYVRVCVDDIPVPVNEASITNETLTWITFARRQQTLIAQFAGYIPEECYVVDELSHVVTIDPNCVEEETLQLILDTMQANSFNFIAVDLDAGEHIVTVEAKLEYTLDAYDTGDPDATLGESAAAAYLGNGSVTIEEVRMVKDEDVIVDF